MDLEQIRRHQGKSIKEKIGEDEFEFKPLGWEYMGNFLSLARKNTGGDIINLDDEAIGMIKDLIFAFVKNSFDMPSNISSKEWDDDLKKFCSANLVKLTEILFKVHDFGVIESDMDKIRNLKNEIGRNTEKR